MPSTVNRWKLLAIEWQDSSYAASFSEALGKSVLNEAMAVVTTALSDLIQRPPEELDGQAVEHLVSALLPGTIAGSEAYARDLPDVLDAFLQFSAESQSLSHYWEWTSAIDRSREAFALALANPDRPRFKSSVAHTPDKRPATKVGRNDPCPCESGSKYKQCCLRRLD